MQRNSVEFGPVYLPCRRGSLVLNRPRKSSEDNSGDKTGGDKDGKPSLAQ